MVKSLFKCTLYSQQPTSKQLMKYHQLNFIHGALFDSQLAQGIGRFIFKEAFWQNTFATKALLKVEYFLSTVLLAVKVVVNAG